MKDYTGQNYQEVIKELKDKHGISSDKIDVEWITGTNYDGGTIISQTPEKGTKVVSEDKITFKVAAYVMPNLIGYTYQDAIAELTALGLSSSHITVFQADATSSTGYSQVKTPSASAVVVEQYPYFGAAIEGNVKLSFSAEVNLSLQKSHHLNLFLSHLSHLRQVKLVSQVLQVAAVAALKKVHKPTHHQLNNKIL